MKVSATAKSSLMQKCALLAPASVWDHVPSAPPDPILGLNDMYKKDTRPEKALLGMGAYRDDNGQPYILPAVRIAEERILANNMNHEYSGIDGIPSFRKNVVKLGWGTDFLSLIHI